MPKAMNALKPNGRHCRECGRRIKKGEVYWTVGAVKPDQPTLDTCSDCHKVQEVLKLAAQFKQLPDVDEGMLDVHAYANP